MERVTFNSLGTRCAGDLYLPETSDPVPGLVLGHSGEMVKEALAFFAPENLIHRLAPTPLLMIANGGWDPYHMLEEAQSAFAKAGEPKRLAVLPYDVLGLDTGPGLEEAMALGTRLADIAPAPTYESVAAMTQ